MTLNTEVQKKSISVAGAWFGHVKGETNRGALAVTLREEHDQLSGELAFDDLVLGRTVAIVKGRLRQNYLDAELSEFRGAPNQLTPTKGRLNATVTEDGGEISGQWSTDAGTSGSFLLRRDEHVAEPATAASQPQTWQTEIKNSPIVSFAMPPKDLKELAGLFRTAAEQARKQHQTWLNDYWHGQPPPAAIAAIPLPMIEIVQGEAFTVTTDLAKLDSFEFKLDLKAISFFTYKQGTPIVPTYGLQVIVTGINGRAAPLPASGVINVHGLEGNWVTGVLERFKGFFAKRRRRRGWLHAATAERLLFLFAVAPLTLLVLYRIFPVLPGAFIRSFVLTLLLAVYVFSALFFLSQRFLNYARRVYPAYEIEFDPHVP
jgi:hypothetical protein